MSYSLMIANGDLSFNGGDFDTVDGSDKLVQDLACCVLEPMGTDSLHPDFGSLIDGGTNASGIVSSGAIGAPNDAYAAALVTGEIRRICNAYQTQQQTRYSNDVQTYGKPTITASEILLSVNNINAVQDTDVLQVSVTLDTGAGQLPVSLPITTTS